MTDNVNSLTTEEQARALEQHLLDEELRSMVRAARDSGTTLKDCQKTLVQALYKELPPGSAKGPIVRQAREMIREVYDEETDSEK